DKLVKVWKRDGADLWLLIHIEVQGTVEPDFADRMYEYNRRIQDRYGHPVVSMAVLTDDRAGWRPDRYIYNELGFALDVRFPIAKLLDYRRRWEALEASANPFATVVMAHLEARATRRRPRARLEA